MNPNFNLEGILESAVIISWADLMRAAETALIHVEYGLLHPAHLDYPRV